MKSLLDPTFVYVPSHATDIRETFRRVRAEQRKQQPDEAKPTPAPLPFARKGAPK